jgi:hypothetical protein
MPREAIALGAVDQVLPVGAIASALLGRVALAGSRSQARDAQGQSRRSR